jgi:hypothetical protein
LFAIGQKIEDPYWAFFSNCSQNKTNHIEQFLHNSILEERLSYFASDHPHHLSHKDITLIVCIATIFLHHRISRFNHCQALWSTFTAMQLWNCYIIGTNSAMQLWNCYIIGINSAMPLHWITNTKTHITCKQTKTTKRIKRTTNTRLSMFVTFHDEQPSPNLALFASHPSCIRISPFHPSTFTMKILDTSSPSHELCFWNRPW